MAINGVSKFVFGADDSTTNDDFVISLGGILGTNNAVSIDGSSGDVSILNRLIVGSDDTGTKLVDVTGNVAGGIAQFTRAVSGAADSAYGTFNIKAHDTDSDMGDNFGAALQFMIEDNTSGEQTIANIQGIRDGADNSGELVFTTYNAGSPVIAMQILSDQTWLYPSGAGGDVDLTNADELILPNGTSETADFIGGTYFDTTDNQLRILNATDDLNIRTHEKLFAFTMASTSPEFVSGGAIPFPPEKDGFNISEIHCSVTGGTSVVFNVSDGTNDTETVTCNTSGASDTNITTNDTFTAGELAEGQIGTITGAVDYLSVSVYGIITSE